MLAASNQEFSNSSRNNDLNDIYHTYGNNLQLSNNYQNEEDEGYYHQNSSDSDNQNNSDVDTLDSQKDQYVNPVVARRLISQSQYPHAHISSGLSSLRVLEDADNLAARSAPQTPSSSGSFDFRPQPHNALTSSSLNVLLDTPGTDSEFKQLVAPSSSLEGYQLQSSTDQPRVSSPPTSPSTEMLTARQHNDPNEFNANENDYAYGNKVEPINDDLGIPSSASHSRAEEDWAERGAAVGKVTHPINENNSTTTSQPAFRIIKRTVKDFKFGRTLGEGSYSTVVLATDKITNKQYAVKILDKKHILKEKKVKYVNIEKNALNRLSNRDGIISLYFTFQDKASLYFVLDYASNGELLSLIKKYQTLSEECTRHFAVQILDAIKYMHDNGVIHRDIKPENILLDDRLRVQITDFGTARILEKKNDESEDYPVDVRAKSFVGTAEYVSPELLENKYCGKPGDIWAFGCIVYQMIAGKPPFRAPNEYLTFQKITKLQYAFSAGFPMVIRDLIKKVLVLQPSKRATISEIQQHFFFKSIDFNDFDQIWSTEVPELGPYKMNAKSMMKVPELTKSTSQMHLNVKKNKKSNNGETSEKRTVSEGANLVNPASVAAFVLKKDDKRGNQDTDESTTDDGDFDTDLSKTTSNSSNTASPRTTTRSASNSQPDYIPGTHILRPTIPARQSYSRGTSGGASQQQKKNSITKQKSRVMDVPAISALEIKWQEYLIHPDERIMRIGPVFAYRQPTEVFHRKNRGLLHNAPLGLASKVQATNNRSGNNNGGQSLLSQVVNGSRSGFRNQNERVREDVGPIIEDESNAIINYLEIEEDLTVPSPSTKSSSGNESSEQPSSSSSHTAKIGKAIFKRFLPQSSGRRDSQEGNGESATLPNQAESTNGTRQYPLDKPRTCTVIITTHGRVLILLRVSDGEDADAYKLVSQIKLGYSFIQFKEVVSSSSKQLTKQVPTTGTFAIELINTTFVFEVESYEVNQWTEALARSKINQFERDREIEGQQQQQSQRSRGSISNRSSSSTINGNNDYNLSTSPRLMDAPLFTRSPSSTMNQHGRKTSGASYQEGTSRNGYQDGITTTPTSAITTTPRRDGSRGGTPSSNTPASHTANEVSSPEGKSQSMLAHKIKTRSSVKRKPPPPIKSTQTLNMSTGLATRRPSGSNVNYQDDNATLHAAQLAVSNSSHLPVSDNRRSSFTKDTRNTNNGEAGHAGGVGAAVGETMNKIAYKFNQQPSHSPKVTSMNSKFLARSQRKK